MLLPQKLFPGGNGTPIHRFSLLGIAHGIQGTSQIMQSRGGISVLIAMHLLAYIKCPAKQLLGQLVLFARIQDGAQIVRTGSRRRMHGAKSGLGNTKSALIEILCSLMIMASVE